MSWAEDTNFSSGPASGQPTKVEPSAAERAQGFVAGASLKVQHGNYVLYLLDRARFQVPLDTATDRTIAGTETLTSETPYRTLTVPNGTTLITAGWRILADTVQIDVGGVIHNDGGAGGGVGNPELAGVGAAPGTATTAYLGGGGNGATGAVANNTAGNQAAALTGRMGGAGGAGGGDNAGEAGGAAQSGTTVPLAAGDFRHLPTAIEMRSWLNDGTIAPRRGGVGGSSGACEGGGGGQGGGGGGGGGGIVVIVCRRLVLNGTIRARGGAGGDAFTTVGTAHGGGGGGGGGVIVLVYHERSGSGTTSVTGGAGGAAGGTGSAGSAGGDGQVVEFQI